MNGLWTILGSGAMLVFVLGVYDRINNRRFEKTKQGTGLRLDDAQYKSLVATTEQTNTATMTAVGAFWQGQFSEVTKQLVAEQEWRKRMVIKLHQHQQWDRKLLARLDDCDIHDLEEPPSLDPDE